MYETRLLSKLTGVGKRKGKKRMEPGPVPNKGRGDWQQGSDGVRGKERPGWGQSCLCGTRLPKNWRESLADNGNKGISSTYRRKRRVLLRGRKSEKTEKRKNTKGEHGKTVCRGGPLQQGKGENDAKEVSS